GAAVTLFNAATGALLGATTVDSTGSEIGQWEFELRTNTPPCRVRVEINGATAERAVSNAPNCGTNPPPANRPPVATITAPAGNVAITQGQSVDFAGSGSDPDGNSITFAWTFQGATPSSATVADPAPVVFNTAGTFTVTLTVRDSLGATASASRTVTVSAQANRPPVAAITAPSGNVTITQGQSVDFAGSGSDPDGNPLTYAWTFGGGTPASATVADPAPVAFNSAGSFTVTFTVGDSAGATASATRTVTVRAPTPPTASADSYSAVAGQTLTVLSPGVLRNDTSSPAGRPLTARLVSNVNSANLLTFNSDGSFIYSPASSFSGTDRFTYQALDGGVASATATVTLTVAAPLPITRAEWEDGELDVRGTGAPARATVILRNASTNAEIARTTSSGRGEWRFDVRRLSAPPCSVRVESGNRVGVRNVSDAPSNCVR
ncbi:MAG TPA: PKD domain-containing protein, partial [Burkholderiales bacterium]|nr:PKD domain-containing protein [Burkholderiales bacterium]